MTGIFDLVHVEHVRFLAAAKNQGRGKREEGRGLIAIHFMIELYQIACFCFTFNTILLIILRSSSASLRQNEKSTNGYSS